MMKIRSVAIVTKPSAPEVSRVANELVEWLRTRGLKASVEPERVSQADLAIVIGGDGTLLAAARLLDSRQVPILAVNYGGLGFLTEVTMAEMRPALDRVLDGDFITESRMMMDITVARPGQASATYRALNDVVINKGTLSRIIELEIRVDGQYVSRFRADGLIVATPTGSTAYNLSAGGPIIFPTMSAMVLTPICSHTLTNRPIVVPPEVKIDVSLQSSQDEVYFTIDGQVGQKFQLNDSLTVQKSDVMVKLVAPADKNYFDVLRGKLKWG